MLYVVAARHSMICLSFGQPDKAVLPRAHAGRPTPPEVLLISALLLENPGGRSNHRLLR